MDALWKSAMETAAKAMDLAAETAETVSKRGKEFAESTTAAAEEATRNIQKSFKEDGRLQSVLNLPHSVMNGGQRDDSLAARAERVRFRVL
jgi:hypothetical protein